MRSHLNTALLSSTSKPRPHVSKCLNLLKTTSYYEHFQFSTTYTFPNVLTFQERPPFTESPPKSKAQAQSSKLNPVWTYRGVLSLSLFLSISCCVSLVSVGLSVNLVSRWRRREISDCRPQRNRSTEPRSRHESLIRRRPCGPAEVSTGPRLPASPSGHWGGPISSSHGEALWP